MKGQTQAGIESTSQTRLPRFSRRRFLSGTGSLMLGAHALASLAGVDANESVSLADGPRPLVKYPGKRELIRVHTRPPHLETPFEVFNESIITPNDAFFVRYHLADFPLRIDPEAYRLSVTGKVRSALELSLADLKSMERVEVVAVNQCSGNSRGYAQPRVFGAQLGNGAMGNARWTGVPLRAVLEKAGVMSTAQQVTFDGLDKPLLPATPDFRKALDIEHALSPEPLLAWAMNGEPLPFLNGYPLKLIVPGYFGTYWVKHLSTIEVIDGDFSGHDAFYMTRGYRLPDNECLCVAPGTKADKTRPISSLPVRSFLTSAMSGDMLPVARDVELQGIAFDGGAGIARVEISLDGGHTWRAARLGEDLGRFSFRPWRLHTQFARPGPVTVMVRATSKGGEMQPREATWNPGGYRRNLIESVALVVA